MQLLRKRTQAFIYEVGEPLHDFLIRVGIVSTVHSRPEQFKAFDGREPITD